MAKNEVEYTAKIGAISISTANSNLDGTGTLDTVINATGEGIRVNRVYVKAIGDVSEGTVRLFLYDGSNTRLIKEVHIKAADQRSVTPAFTAIIKFEPILFIPNGWSLKASTQNANSFKIVADGVQWDYPVSESKIEYSSAMSTGVVSTANNSLAGIGTMTPLVTGANNGTRVDNVYIKATGDTTNGMIRFFINSGGRGSDLIMEIPVPAINQTSVTPSFSKVINFRGGLMIPNSYILYVSTENSETFALTANAITWDYI